MSPIRTATTMTLALTLALAGCTSGDDTSADREAGVGETIAEISDDTAEAADAATDGEVAPMPPEPPEPGEETEFADHGVADWTTTSDQDVSTFQTHGDVASFRLAQTWLDANGVLPPAEAVRADEWINALDHDYPQPDGGETFAIHSDGGEPLWQRPPEGPQSTQLLRVGIQGAPPQERSPASITFVIDTSGSMSTNDRLDILVDAISDFVDDLDPADQVAVVEFDDDARTVIEHTDDVEAVTEELATLQPDGSTNTSAGLLLGHEHAAEAHRDGDNSSVVLLADGMANQGVTDPDALADEVDGLDHPTRIVTHTVGIGTEVYNDALLETVARETGGTYAYINSPEHAQQLFDRDLPLLDPVAHDVKAQVTFDPDAVSSWRLIGYESRELDEDDFTDDDVTGGYVGANHTVTALYEVEIDTEGGEATGPVGTAAVRWADPDSGDVDQIEQPLTLDDGSDTFDLAAAMAATAEHLRESQHVAVDLDQIADAADGIAGGEVVATLARAAAGAGQAETGQR